MWLPSSEPLFEENVESCFFVCRNGDIFNNGIHFRSWAANGSLEYSHLEFSAVMIGYLGLTELLVYRLHKILYIKII